nr:putative hAT transposon superfamily [Tanacetum cinerariifolium]
MASSELEQVEVNSQKHDPAWKHCQMYKNTNDDKVQLKCIYCGKFFKGGGIHRIKEHLAGQKGNASSCLRVHPDVRLLMQDSLNCVVVKKKKKQKLSQDITSFNNVNEYGLNNVNEDVVMVPVPVNQSVAIEASVSNGKRRKRGGRVRKGLGSSSALVVADDNVFDDDVTNRVNVNVNNQVSLAIGRFLFDAGVSLDAVNSAHFQPMIDVIAAHGPGVVGPSYHDMRGWVLKNMVQEVRSDVDQCMGTWGKSGCSVLVDECRSENGNMFLNFSVCCPEGLMFLRSVDGTNILDSAEGLFSLFKEVVEEVGVRNVLQIVTNNEARYVEIGKQIADNFPTIFWTPCATECVDLILEDFRELELISTILEQARSISRFIYNHSDVLNMMRRYTFGVDIVVVGPTRASTDFLTLKRMVSLKHNLQSMVSSDEWMECTYSKKDEGYSTLDYISNPSFWSMCTVITHLTDPLLRLFRIVSGKKTPGMGYVYAAVYRAKEAIKKEVVDKKNYMVYWNIIDRRWEQLHRHSLHTAGFYLNPKFFYSTEGDIHLQIRSSVYDCVERLIPETSIQDKIVRETTSYREAAGDFGRKIAIRGRDTLFPAEWWSTYGGACPNLARLAIRILSQPCSLVGCMPNKIPFQQMHETKNYVENERLSDIVFVQYNLRLKQMLMNKEQDNPDPISYDNIKSVEAWVTEREILADDVGRSDWMTVEPPLGNVMVLGPQVDDFEALGEGFGDQEIFDGLKDSEEENGENIVQL